MVKTIYQLAYYCSYSCKCWLYNTMSTCLNTEEIISAYRSANHHFEEVISYNKKC